MLSALTALLNLRPTQKMMSSQSVGHPAKKRRFLSKFPTAWSNLPTGPVSRLFLSPSA
jgi:hypothetical protein